MTSRPAVLKCSELALTPVNFCLVGAGRAHVEKGSGEAEADASLAGRTTRAQKPGGRSCAGHSRAGRAGREAAHSSMTRNQVPREKVAPKRQTMRSACGRKHRRVTGRPLPSARAQGAVVLTSTPLLHDCATVAGSIGGAGNLPLNGSVPVDRGRVELLQPQSLAFHCPGVRLSTTHAWKLDGGEVRAHRDVERGEPWLCGGAGGRER